MTLRSQSINEQQELQKYFDQTYAEAISIGDNPERALLLALERSLVEYGYQQDATDVDPYVELVAGLLTQRLGIDDRYNYNSELV